RLIAVERRARRVNAGVEVFRAAFRAENQGLGRGRGGCDERGRANRGEQDGSVHGGNSAGLFGAIDTNRQKHLQQACYWACRLSTNLKMAAITYGPATVRTAPGHGLPSQLRQRCVRRTPDRSYAVGGPAFWGRRGGTIRCWKPPPAIGETDG